LAFRVLQQQLLLLLLLQLLDEDLDPATEGCNHRSRNHGLMSASGAQITNVQ
jgi:hypothetical protein